MRGWGPDPEQRRRSAEADELVLAIAARLLGEARLAGAFPTGRGALAAFAARVAADLHDDEHLLAPGEAWRDLPWADCKVRLDEPTATSVRLRCHCGHHSYAGSLRIDGRFDEQSHGVTVSLDDPDSRELSPHELTVLERAAKHQAELAPGKLFGGEEFLRAIPLRPQPGAAVQVLAIALFGDGVVVHHTFDDPAGARSLLTLETYEQAGVDAPIEELRSEAEAEGGTLTPTFTLSDDLGTRYRRTGGGWSGVEVAHGEARFVPAVPADATRLVVSSYAGTVEVRL